MTTDYRMQAGATVSGTAPLVRPNQPPVVLTTEESVACRFNVMPGLDVTESLQIKEYRLWPWFIEGVFDRTYTSAMADSPSHLIFLTMCIHTQKMLYVWFCYHLGRSYEPNAPEFVKFWPTKIDIRVPTLIDDDRDLVHQVQILSLDWKGSAAGKIRLRSACSTATITSDCPFFLVKRPTDSENRDERE